MDSWWNKFVLKFFQYAPSFVVCLTFLPCGLVYGYTLSAFAAERNVKANVSEYGPLILGVCWCFVVALVMFLIKFYKGRFVFWHIYLLLAAGVFNLIASCFYFADGFDNAGAFVSYLGHGMTFIAGLCFLLTIPGRCTRAIFLSTCFTIYLLGIAAAVSLISSAYNKNHQQNPNGTEQQLIEGIYVNFAAVYLSLSAVVLAILVGMKILGYLGTVDYENSLDNEFRIANSNGSVFDKRDEVIKRISFFYVTKNQQWNVTLLLIFTEAVQYALFIYFVFWFSLNTQMRLTENLGDVDAMLWVVFAGSVFCNLCLVFFSVKVTFVANEICLIVLTILSMIICSSVHTRVPLWLVLFFFGMSFPNLQVAIVEMSHLRYTEINIFISYFCKLLSTSIVYYYFVSNSKNSYFYATDESTLMAQGFVFIIITALVALVVAMKVPRTYRMPLLEIQYGLWGIIFKKHQIEQLNVKYLNDGTIPTISRPESF